jgi:glycerol-3-phosphate acyltransferase PlsY
MEIPAVALAYLVGSIPFSFLVARRRGIDLRVAGSGNVGAANVFRTSGIVMGVTAMCLDAAKGVVAVLLAERMTADTVVPIAAGVASIVGHIYPVWLGFRGGKGVATAAGVFAVVAPTAFAIATVVFVIAVSATRYVSVGSLAGAVTIAVVTLLSDVPPALTTAAVLTTMLIIHRHRENLTRLIAGTERRVGR